MPQTSAGVSTLKKFMAEYGKKKGKSVFFGKVNSSHNFAKAMGETSVRKRAGKK